MLTAGSMTGMRNTIAKLVVNKLLTTFSNNDFINVLNFSWTASPVVPCFQSLVQANVRNLKHLREAVEEVKPLGNASVPHAFEAAFEQLREVSNQKLTLFGKKIYIIYLQHNIHTYLPIYLTTGYPKLYESTESLSVKLMHSR